MTFFLCYCSVSLSLAFLGDASLPLELDGKSSFEKSKNLLNKFTEPDVCSAFTTDEILWKNESNSCSGFAITESLLDPALDDGLPERKKQHLVREVIYLI